jgi:hypothetical protein
MRDTEVDGRFEVPGGWARNLALGCRGSAGALTSGNCPELAAWRVVAGAMCLG